MFHFIPRKALLNRIIEIWLRNCFPIYDFICTGCEGPIHWSWRCQWKGISGDIRYSTQLKESSKCNVQIWKHLTHFFPCIKIWYLKIHKCYTLAWSSRGHCIILEVHVVQIIPSVRSHILIYWETGLRLSKQGVRKKKLAFWKKRSTQEMILYFISRAYNSEKQKELTVCPGHGDLSGWTATEYP